MNQTRPPVIAVDLDGTLAHYDHWRGPEHIGEPIEPMLENVKAWLKEGKQVVIFTARLSDPRAKGVAKQHIRAWLQQHGLPDLPITNVKTFDMVSLYDDRCKQVVPNAGVTVEGLYTITRGFVETAEVEGACACKVVAKALMKIIRKYDPRD